MLSRLLFGLSRNRHVDRGVRFGFAHLSALLPVRRVCATNEVIAFHHPRPSWEHHILFVPKVGIPALTDIREDQVTVVRQLVKLALDVASREPFDQSGFALLANGGAYQDVGQLHFHLVSPPGKLAYVCPHTLSTDVLLQTDSLVASRHPRPRRATHIVMSPLLADPAACDAGCFDNDFIEAVFDATPKLVRTLNLGTDGYTLVISTPPDRTAPGSCVHLVAGSELV